MKTRFRAFQLDSPGSLFGYYKPGEYTLIEARIPKGGIEVLRADINSLGISTISVLHITSWDDDHCNYQDLTQILNHFRPTLIEVPSYEPATETGRLCQRVLFEYDRIHQRNVWNVVKRDRENINALQNAVSWGENHVVFHSHYNSDNKNDMSQIKLFRSLGFNVLSLGDCESTQISANLVFSSIITKEIDILILPHHGSSNSCLTGEFLDKIKPKIAVCSSNFGNEYDHPRPGVVQLLRSRNIEIMSTKRGDAIISFDDNSNTCVAHDLMSDNSEIHKEYTFKSKRYSHELIQSLDLFLNPQVKSLLYP
jgi:competence protein ComEC